MSISTKQETFNTTKETLPLHHRNVHQSLRCIANVPFHNSGQIKLLISSITWAPLVSTSTTNADLSARIAQQASPVALPKQLQAMYRVPWRVKTLWKTPESQEDWRRCERLILLSKFLSRRPWLQVVSARTLQVSTWSLLSPQKAAYSPKQ